MISIIQDKWWWLQVIQVWQWLPQHRVSEGNTCISAKVVKAAGSFLPCLTLTWIHPSRMTVSYSVHPSSVYAAKLSLHTTILGLKCCWDDQERLCTKTITPNVGVWLVSTMPKTHCSAVIVLINMAHVEHKYTLGLCWNRDSLIHTTTPWPPRRRGESTDVSL